MFIVAALMHAYNGYYKIREKLLSKIVQIDMLITDGSIVTKSRSVFINQLVYNHLPFENF